MKVLRTLVACLLMLSLPIEGMASVAMAHCKDTHLTAGTSSVSMQAGHDHAAMMAMASMSDADSAAHMQHAAPSENAEGAKDVGASEVGCQCGCDCSGDCAVSCAGMMLSLTAVGLSLALADVAIAVAMPQGQAHAAYLYDPLRPPSAVAL